MSDATAPSTIPGNAPDAARPDYCRPEYVAGQPARDLCHALMQGTDGVRALGQEGLPKWPAEKAENYKLRSKAAKLSKYYARTVEASVGMICATPPTLAEGADPILVADAEDIDGRGTHLEVFARHIAQDAIDGGFCAILVDAPPLPDGLKLTLADEQALGLRPFFVPITADRIISWIVEVPEWGDLLAMWKQGALQTEQVRSFAKQVITRQVVIHEPTDVTTGQFGVVCMDRYRVLRLDESGVTFTVWEKRKADGAAGEHFVVLSSGPMNQAGGVPFREIPLAMVYAGRPVAPFVAQPPLLGLAELNLDHYQVTADRRYLMRLCHAPTLFLAGFMEEIDETGQKVPVEVGPNSVLTASDANAKAAYVSADPNALTSSKEEKEELVRQMAVLGMSFIGKDKRGMAETATGRALDNAAESASHATAARGLQDGLEQAFRFYAQYRGVKPPEVVVNTSYASPDVDPQIAAVIWSAVAAGELPVEVFTSYLQTGEIPDDVQEQIDALRFMKATQEADAQAMDATQGTKTAASMQIEYEDGKPVRLTPSSSSAKAA